MTSLPATTLLAALVGCGTVEGGDEADGGAADAQLGADAAELADAGPPPPDGTPVAACDVVMVAWTQGPPRTREVWISNPDGTGARNLSQSEATDDYIPAWSPRGDRVAFHSNRDGNGVDIYVAPVAGGQPVSLTDIVDQMNGHADDGFPLWSPDGSKVAFERGGRLWLIASDGTLPTKIAATADMPAGTADASWSPDGRFLAFTSGGVRDVYVVPIAGGRVVQVTNTPTSSESGPRWSPDGARLTFASGGDVWVAASDGSGAINLTPNTASAEQAPHWTPDGAWIAFSSDREGGVYKVHRVPAAGGAAVRVSDNSLPDAGGGSTNGEHVTGVSPDGRRVAFTRNFDGTPSNSGKVIAGTVAIDGSDLVTFPEGATNASRPSWSPCMEAAP